MVEGLPFQYQKREFWEFYCPICKNQRRSFYWPSPRKRHYVQLAVLTACASVFLWPWLGPKGLIVSVPAWALFEFFYRARARQSLICPHCGFDPYLYKYDVKLARQKVEKFFADKTKAKEQRKAAQADAALQAAQTMGQPSGSTDGNKK